MMSNLPSLRLFQPVYVRMYVANPIVFIDLHLPSNNRRTLRYNVPLDKPLKLCFEFLFIQQTINVCCINKQCAVTWAIGDHRIPASSKKAITVRSESIRRFLIL